MTLTSDLIEQTRMLLFADSRPERNQLNAAITAGATSFTLRYDTKSARAGQTLGVDLEEMHVWQEVGQTVTVQRGDAGSTAAAHSEGANVWVGRFTPWRILNAVNEELRSLSAHGLYRIATTELSWDVYGEYDVDAYDLLGIVSLTEDHPSAAPSTIRDYQLLRDIGDTNQILRVHGLDAASTLTLTYRTIFGELAELDEDVADATGLWVSAHDIVPLGAAIRLLTGTEAARNQLVQGDTRRMDEVPAGSRTNSMRPLMARYAERVRDEALRLRAQYPDRVR